MRKIVSALAVAVVLSGAAYAQNFQKGLAAAQAGDYVLIRKARTRGTV